MTRWKTGHTTVIITTHAHNQWSRWNDFKLSAAMNRGLPVGVIYSRNGSGDGSVDTHHYVPTEALARIGGIEALDAAAFAALNAEETSP